MADFLGMMKQAAQLQSKMRAMQEELGQIEVEGIEDKVPRGRFPKVTKKVLDSSPSRVEDAAGAPGDVCRIRMVEVGQQARVIWRVRAGHRHFVIITCPSGGPGVKAWAAKRFAAILGPNDDHFDSDRRCRRAPAHRSG